MHEDCQKYSGSREKIFTFHVLREHEFHNFIAFNIFLQSFVFLYFQVMLRALKIVSSLNLKSTLRVFDQAI